MVADRGVDCLLLLLGERRGHQWEGRRLLLIAATAAGSECGCVIAAVPKLLGQQWQGVGGVVARSGNVMVAGRELWLMAAAAATAWMEPWQSQLRVRYLIIWLLRKGEKC